MIKAYYIEDYPYTKQYLIPPMESIACSSINLSRLSCLIAISCLLSHFSPPLFCLQSSVLEEEIEAFRSS